MNSGDRDPTGQIPFRLSSAICRKRPNHKPMTIAISAMELAWPLDHEYQPVPEYRPRTKTGFGPELPQGCTAANRLFVVSRGLVAFAADCFDRKRGRCRVDLDQCRQLRQCKCGSIRIEWQIRQRMASVLAARLRDLQQGIRGGPEFIYRLRVQQAVPDFAVSLKTDVINVVQGARTEIDVAVERKGGCVAPVELIVDGLPEGIRIEGQQVAAGQASVKLAFVADAEARSCDVTLRNFRERPKSTEHLDVKRQRPAQLIWDTMSTAPAWDRRRSITCN